MLIIPWSVSLGIVGAPSENVDSRKVPEGSRKVTTEGNSKRCFFESRKVVRKGSNSGNLGQVTSGNFR